MPLFTVAMRLQNKYMGNSPSITANNRSAHHDTRAAVLAAIQQVAPAIRFVAGTRFYWSAKRQTVTYVAKALRTEQGLWSLLHETGHALLGHCNYESDFGLLQLEVAAWQKAKTLSAHLDTNIDETYIQDCLDTYRDWLHRRATCPTCGVVSMEQAPLTYVCHNCMARWSVSSARFCRPYRRITQ